MDSEIETCFSTCRNFAAEALKTSPAFEPCLFTFGKHEDATQFVEIPWPLTEETLELLGAQFALARVEAYAIVLKDRLRIEGEDKDMLLIWMCKRAFTWGRAWELSSEGLAPAFREIVDPAALRAKAFQLLNVGPMSRKHAKRVREFFEKNSRPAGAVN